MATSDYIKRETLGLECDPLSALSSVSRAPLSHCGLFFWGGGGGGGDPSAAGKIGFVNDTREGIDNCMPAFMKLKGSLTYESEPH